MAKFNHVIFPKLLLILCRLIHGIFRIYGIPANCLNLAPLFRIELLLKIQNVPTVFLDIILEISASVLFNI